jgi:erythrin-vacuolar iron transport family protein
MLKESGGFCLVHWRSKRSGNLSHGKGIFRVERKEILALAISLEEDDARIYGDYADRLKADYPDTAKMLKRCRTKN